MGRKPWAFLCVVALLAPVLQIASMSTASADATAVVDDRSVDIATKAFWYTGLDAATVNADLAANKARPTNLDVRVVGGVASYTVAMVRNAGAYLVKSWWWDPADTGAQLDANVASRNARLIDLEPFVTPAGTRFSAVMVANTQAAQRQWWYAYDTDLNTIQSMLTTNNARLIDNRGYVVGGTTEYAAVMVSNTGGDAKSWVWYNNVSAAFVQQQLDSFGYRLTSAGRDPGGGFDVIMQLSEGEAWWWATNLTKASAVTSLLKQHHARLLNVSTYTVSGKTKFAVVAIDNTNATSNPINAESTRIQTVLKPGLGGGTYGAYLEAVGGPEIVGFNENFRFEPASGIKVLYFLHAMQLVQAGTENLDTPNAFTYYVDPSDPTNPDVCPDPAWEVPANAVHTTLRDALTKTMVDSDNRTTRGLFLRYGMAPENALAASIGMSNTALRQSRIGCGFVGAVRNDFTLADAGKLYEDVANGTLLDAPDAATFNQIMIGGTPPASSTLGDIVRAEAASLGKSPADAASFIADIDYREKGGTYFFCLVNGCTTYKTDMMVSGCITLPFKSSGTIVPTSFVYGRFVNDLVIPCVVNSGCAAETKARSAIDTLGTGAETFRSEIRAALSTW
jgi:hypothetical protein